MVTKNIDTSLACFDVSVIYDVLYTFFFKLVFYAYIVTIYFHFYDTNEVS